MHIGNLKAALFGYLLAKSSGGAFVLRIEDTDQGRIVDGAVDAIYNTLKAAGITHDEGPDIGGPYAPYMQSHRKDGYMQYAEELVAQKKAYRCFCSKERLEGLGGSYDRHCLSLPDDDIEAKLAANAPHVIRQLIPEGRTAFKDEVFGEIAIDNKEIEDQVLIKSDGMPTYNFANVIDDHLMAITHVMRGSEYLTSTPKYNLLYTALGWDIPTYIHLPLVLNAAGEKMSKRKGDASFEDLLNLGYLPSAIVNYIVLLGFTPPDNKEIFTLQELVEVFNIAGMSKSPAIFDMSKLSWVNSEHIKAMPAATFFELAAPYLDKAVINKNIDKKALAAMVQGRVSTLNDIYEQLDFIDNLPEYDIELYNHKKMKSSPDTARAVLSELAPKLIGFAQWDNDALYAFLTDFAKGKELKPSSVLWPLRVAISGKAATPGGATELMALLGKDEALRRIELATRMLNN